MAQVVADANCFSFLETIPLGFVPRFGGENEDVSFTFGVRGLLDVGTGLDYDFSVQRGSNRSDFAISNTVNASLGPDTPRNFTPGGQEQTETLVNASFVYNVDVGFESDLSVAFGAEYRKEEFDLFAGDPASYALGPLADQGFSSSSNGFGGFPADTSASQDSNAIYVDLEADVSENLTLQTAVRYEDFSQFGDTTDFKLAGIYHVSDSVRIRSAYSTGFHAPTAGQANITNVTTQNVNGVLIDQGTLPLFSSAGQLAADFIELDGNGRPTLGPEEAENFSIGAAFDLGDTSWTIDYYTIELTDRVAAIEDLLPNLRANVSWAHSQGDYNTLVRANYYGGWDDTGNGVNGISSAVLVDVSVSYQLNENTRLVAGIDNVFDTYPDKNPSAGSLGQLYSEASPFGFNGGTWYLQARYTY
nr:TonB-dependent receptor [Opacimonas viscosa]